MRALRFIWFGMGALGLLAVWGGYALPHRTLTLLGAALLSGMLVAMGIEAIGKREYRTARVDVHLPHGGSFTFRGAAAILKGAAFILLGAAGFVAVLIVAAGQEQDALRLALRRPGLVLFGAGALLAGWGSARVLGAVEWRASWWELVRTLPERYSGLLMILAGLGAAGVGLWEILDPVAFDEWMAGILGPGARLAQP